MAYDPRVISALKRYAQILPEDARDEYVATALVESGLNPRAVGDSGNSVGLFQENIRGRGAGLSFEDRANPENNARRAAQEFLTFHRRGARGEMLAYRAQRPADMQGYLAKIRARLGEARRILGLPDTGGDPAEAPATVGAQAPGAAQPTTTANPNFGATLAASLAARPRGQSLSRTIAGAVLAQAMAGQQAPAPEQAASSAQRARGGQPQSAPPGDGSRPTGGSPQLIGTPYAGTHSLGNWQSDNAIDLRVPEGTPIYALDDGVIGPRIGPLGRQNGGRFDGQRLTLVGSGNEYYYAHLSRLAVGAGERVKRGQLLGWSGSANGVPHLHLGVRNGDPRQYTNR